MRWWRKEEEEWEQDVSVMEEQREMEEAMESVVGIEFDEPTSPNPNHLQIVQEIVRGIVQEIVEER